MRGRRIAELLKQAGFHEELRGEDRPPVSEYHLGTDGTGLSVEFLAPRSGSPTRRDGRPDETVEVGGVTAQKLRYVDLLLLESWSVRLSDGDGFPFGPEGLGVRVANPASFIAQKLLVLARRASGKQPKDVLYVHDTALMFSDSLDALRACWHRVRQELHSRVRNEVVELARERFAAVDDLARRAALVARASGRATPPTPEQLVAVCRAAAAAIFEG